MGELPLYEHNEIDAATLSQNLISQNAFINLFERVRFPTKSSPHCLPLLIEISSQQVCGEVKFQVPEKLIDTLCQISAGSGLWAQV